MQRIGDFSRLSRVSVKTLRYYDEVGLFKPAMIDAATGYRSYSFDQLPRLYRILALKDLGFSLEEIGHLLEDELPVAQLRGMIAQREAEIRQRMAEDIGRLSRVGRLLRSIEEENHMAIQNVVIKPIEAIKVAAVRGVVPTPPEQGVLWDELMTHLNAHKARVIGPPQAIYHDPDYRERDWDIEVCMPIAEDLPAAGRVAVKELPAVPHMACLVHVGPFVTLNEAYSALGQWLEQNGYQAAGPARELNLRLPDKPGDQHDPNTVNEIQFPVTRTAA